MSEVIAAPAGLHLRILDAKGRVVLPRPLRLRLGSPFVLTRAPGNCLLALTLADWDRVRRRWGDDPLFRQYYLPTATTCCAHPTNGRISIPHLLRRHAGLRAYEDVALAGPGECVVLGSWARLHDLEEVGRWSAPGAFTDWLPRPEEICCPVW